VVAKIRERLVMNNKGHKEMIWRCSISRKLNKVDGKEKYRVEVSNRSIALEDFDAEEDINIAL
jgi:hypothetical protein